MEITGLLEFTEVSNEGGFRNFGLQSTAGWNLTAVHSGAGVTRAEAASFIHDAVTLCLYPDYGVMVCVFIMILFVDYIFIYLCYFMIFVFVVWRYFVDVQVYPPAVCGMH